MYLYVGERVGVLVGGVVVLVVHGRGQPQLLLLLLPGGGGGRQRHGGRAHVGLREGGGRPMLLSTLTLCNN